MGLEAHAASAGLLQQAEEAEPAFGGRLLVGVIGVGRFRGLQRIPFGEVFLDLKIGATNEDALAAMGFDVESMLHEVRNRHLGADTTLGESWALGLLQSYPYLTRE